MFAVVKAGQVTREIKGGPFNADNGIQYPANIFSLWSIDDLINIGIYPVEETSNNLDPRVERETGKVEFVINNKSVSKLKIKSDISITTVKNNEIQHIKSNQHSILNSTDWYYIRKMDKGTAIPTDVQNFRDAVRTTGDKMIDDVNTVADKAGFQALYPIWDKDRKNTGGTLGIWPDPKDYNL